MSNTPHPAVLANETINALERVSDGSNAEPILRVTVGKDSKRYSKLKRELLDSERPREDLLNR